jgi:hypothetical protein
MKHDAFNAALKRLFRGDPRPIESGEPAEQCDNHRHHSRFGKGYICLSCYARQSKESFEVGPEALYSYAPSESQKKDLKLVYEKVSKATKDAAH